MLRQQISNISNLSKSCFYHILALRHIRPAFTDDVANTIACSLVGCRIDYANSILFGKLAKKHRTASSNPVHSDTSRYITTRTNQYHEDVRGPTLLHEKYRIDFKVATLICKVVLSGEPSYLPSIINIDAPRRALRSSADNRRLFVLQFKTKTGTRAFRHSASFIWNTANWHSQCYFNIAIFKKSLKDILFPTGLQLTTIVFICDTDST